MDAFCSVKRLMSLFSLAIFHAFRGLLRTKSNAIKALAAFTQLCINYQAVRWRGEPEGVLHTVGGTVSIVIAEVLAENIGGSLGRSHS